jgi:hypothetical protein
MHPPDEFLRHASECELMAKFTRDPQSSATWKGMAQRWRQCAELAKQQNSLVRAIKQTRRPTTSTSAHA